MTRKLRPFVFGCDAHVAEPPDLFVRNMPEHLKQFVIHSEADGDIRITRIGEQVILKIWTNFHQHKTGEGDAAFNAQSADRSCTDAADNFVSDCAVDTKRRGARDLELRLADMDRDGVDAELVFPSLGLMLPRIADLPAADGLFVESLMSSIAQGDEAAKERVRAFLEKRAAKVSRPS